jgi:hypothetical protein
VYSGLSVNCKVSLARSLSYFSFLAGKRRRSRKRP